MTHLVELKARETLAQYRKGLLSYNEMVFICGQLGYMTTRKNLTDTIHLSRLSS